MEEMEEKKKKKKKKEDSNIKILFLYLVMYENFKGKNNEVLLYLFSFSQF